MASGTTFQHFGNRSEFLSLLLISLSNLVDVDSGVCRDTWRATGPVLQTWSLTIRESRGLPVKTPRCQPQQIGDESLARAGCKYYDSVRVTNIAVPDSSYFLTKELLGMY